MLCDAGGTLCSLQQKWPRYNVPILNGSFLLGFHVIPQLRKALHTSFFTRKKAFIYALLLYRLASLLLSYFLLS